MTATQEKHVFQAEVQELLGLVIHSLYKHREIFLRELISNASDAIDKLRVETLKSPELGQAEGAAIRIRPDKSARTLTVEDDGVGMSHDDLLSNLGTIARSGTRAFLERLRAAGETTPELIGQFGVGFYSSFMVADEVVVETKKIGESQAWRWRSEGKGGYTLEPCERERHGTSVKLVLKQQSADEDEDPGEYLEERELRDIVKRYSDFVAHPIQLALADGKLETLNSMRPLWARPKDEVKQEEYEEFYRHIAHDWTPPAETIHFRAEGTTEYTALLFIPGRRPLDLFDGSAGKSRIALYVKRILIMPESQDLLPPWLRFVRGIVDAPDLPLNVSREVLQANPAVRQIQKRLTKRVLEALAQMLEKERATYRKVWVDFGVVLKEGIYYGADEDGRISKIALFETSQAEEPTTLAEYVARMKPDQKAIYYLSGNERKALEGSPHLESFTRRGLEVLFMVDPIDEWMLERLGEFDGKPLKPIDRGDLELESPSEKEAREKLDRDQRDALQAIESELTDEVKNVRFSTRLSESPAVLVNDDAAVSANMERILRAANQDVKKEKRILELNADHPLVQRVLAQYTQDPRAERFRDWIALLYGQALLAEGSPLPDPARFAKLVTKLALAT